MPHLLSLSKVRWLDLIKLAKAVGSQGRQSKRVLGLEARMGTLAGLQCKAVLLAQSCTLDPLPEPAAARTQTSASPVDMKQPPLVCTTALWAAVLHQCQAEACRLSQLVVGKILAQPMVGGHQVRPELAHCTIQES